MGSCLANCGTYWTFPPHPGLQAVLPRKACHPWATPFSPMLSIRHGRGQQSWRSPREGKPLAHGHTDGEQWRAGPGSTFQAVRGWGRAARGVRPEWGAQVAARLGLPGAQSHGHREQEHPNWLRSLLPALSAEAPVKGWSCPGCPRLSLLRGPAWPPTRGSAADTTCLGWHGFSLRPELRSSWLFGLPTAGLVPSSGIFPPHLWLAGGAATET